MGDEVQQDQSDFKGGFRWANLWSVVFFSLDSVVMILSLVLYMCLVKAVARNRHKVRKWFYCAGLPDGLFSNQKS
jgi:hypothetical protein